MNITPVFISQLRPGQVFVFGSNERGQHGGGAAKTAIKWGAKWGQGEGLAGQTYALPTKRDFKTTLSLEKIQGYVNNLEKTVDDHPELHFLITPVGCGLAGLTVEQVAPLFRNFMDITNCSLPQEFINQINNISDEK
jgi:hypothetical protein